MVDHGHGHLTLRQRGMAMGEAEIGLIGLGTMGAMLSLNIAEKGHRIAVYNRTTARTTEFMGEAEALVEMLTPTETLEDLVAAIAPPRAIILMVPAGPAVDAQIEALRPLLGRRTILSSTPATPISATPAPGPRRPRPRAGPSSGSVCRAGPRAPAMAPRSWAAARGRPGTGWPISSPRSRPGTRASPARPGWARAARGIS